MTKRVLKLGYESYVLHGAPVRDAIHVTLVNECLFPLGVRFLSQGEELSVLPLCVPGCLCGEADGVGETFVACQCGVERVLGNVGGKARRARDDPRRGRKVGLSTGSACPVGAARCPSPAIPLGPCSDSRLFVQFGSPVS